MNAAKLLSLPILHRAASVVFPPTGQHRAPRLPGQLAAQRFVHCLTCGVETAATVHGTALLCTEGHQINTTGGTHS